MLDSRMKLWLYLAIALAGGVGAGAWRFASLGDATSPHEKRLAATQFSNSPVERKGTESKNVAAVTLARFEGRHWQRGVVDPPAAVVAAPVAVPVPMVQLPPDVQLAGVLVGSAPELGSAFLRIGSGPVETIRVGQGPKARPEVVVTEITREGITVRYQGQLLPKSIWINICEQAKGCAAT